MAGGKFDEAKGRAKEAAGDITGNEEMQQSGKVDRATGSIKDKVNEVADKLKGALRRER